MNNIAVKEHLPITMGDGDVVEIGFDVASDNSVRQMTLHFSKRDVVLQRLVNEFRYAPLWKRLLLAWRGRLS